MSQRFTHGVFTCKACKRSTRGNRDSAEHGYCAEDWELAAWYNSMQDGHDIEPGIITSLTQRIVELGGTLDADAKELLEYVGA